MDTKQFETEFVNQVEKLKAEGYTLDLLIQEEFVFWDKEPDKKYLLNAVKQGSFVCRITETIVFPVVLPSGKGTAVYDYKLTWDD